MTCRAVQGGANDGIAPLPFQTCRMLSINCTLAPQIAGFLDGTSLTTSGGSLAKHVCRHVLAGIQPPTHPHPTHSPPTHSTGFPVRVLPLEPPGYVAKPGQTVQGSDFPCDGSLLAGACAMPTALGAVLVCTHNPACLTVVIYPNGGCLGWGGSREGVGRSSTMGCGWEGCSAGLWMGGDCIARKPRTLTTPAPNLHSRPYPLLPLPLQAPTAAQGSWVCSKSRTHPPPIP